MAEEDVVGGRGLKFCFDIVLIIIAIPVLEHGIRVRGEILGQAGG